MINAPSRRLALCDTDNCIVDTTFFIPCLITVLEELIFIDPAEYEAEMSKFYTPGLGYDIELHLDQMYGQSLADLRPRLSAGLRPYDIMYPSAVVMMGQLLADPFTTVAAVTSGRFSFQSLKFEHLNYELPRRLGRQVPHIEGLAVCGKKADHFAEPWADSFTFNGLTFDEVLVVDDHPGQIGAFAPRPGLKLVQARHTNAKYGPVESRPDIEQVPDLSVIH